MLALSVLALASGTAWSIIDDGTEIKVASVATIVIVLSSLTLSARGMLIQLAAVALCLLAVFAMHGLNAAQMTESGFVLVITAAVVGLIQGRRRDRLGLRQVSAEKVIGLIRDRLLVQAQLPSVPAGWQVEIQQRPADGAAIAGDFVSSRLVSEGNCQILHLAVIDVSGSGIAAGPRALLLSGAVGGLLGAVSPDQFLPAANEYLSRQQWSLGFASALYVRLNLCTGEYGVRVAGHPPAVQFRPDGSPPWRTSPATGTVLGVRPSMAGVIDEHVLRPGEALFLYTDGVVEDRTRDIDAGTLRLKQQVEFLVAASGWDGLAAELIEAVPAKHDDDRTVVMIRRDPALVVPASVDVGSPDRAAVGH